MRDFSLSQYDDLCRALVVNGWQTVSMGDYLQGQADESAKIALLRHDVDSRPTHALKLAAIEQAGGLRATYFFRTVPSAFDAGVITKIAAMGHEVGYHYETLAQTRGDIPQALALFERELARLRALAPVRVAAMHGSPLFRWDNRDIWGHATPADFGLIGEAYRDLDYTRVIYLNDTGRTWNPARYNLRDSTGIMPPVTLESTPDLIAWLGTTPAAHVCLSTHPERWQSGLAWYTQQARDVALNSLKVGLSWVRSGKK